MRPVDLAKYFLKIGLAFVFIYASVEIYLHPDNFLKYIPPFMMDFMPIDLFLDVFGVAEVLLAIWLLSGWKVQYPSIISFLLMVGIVVMNPEYFQVLFRNVAIGFGSLALAALEMARERTSIAEKFRKISNEAKREVIQKIAVTS